MKKLFNCLAIFSLFAAVSCDKVKTPYQEKEETAVGSKFIIQDNKSVSNSKKGLFIDVLPICLEAIICASSDLCKIESIR